MSLDGWIPLSQRGNGHSDAELVLVEGVPPVLRPALRDWLGEYLNDGHHAARVALRLGIEATMAREALMALEGEQLLGAVDAALHFHPDITPSAQPVDVLALVASKNLGAAQLVPALLELLTDAGSAWTVSPSWAALEQRVDPTVRRAPTTAAKAAKKVKRPEAARDLAEAWTKVYGRHPDPSGAYRLAIRAVEDVAVPVVLPTDKSATLGKVRTHLRDTSARWRTSMGPGAEPVVAMISSLWISQTDRHAGQADLARIDQPAAEQALHLATTLVQWFASGHVQRVP